MHRYSAVIKIIGVNPYVEIPGQVLAAIMVASGKKKGPIPVHGKLNGEPFIQTVVKFQGMWRLYLNGPMRNATKTEVGDTVTIAMEYDPKPRIIEMPKLFAAALKDNPEAQKKFSVLPPYRQKEINRYLSFLKSENALKRNIDKVIRHLLGEEVPGVLFYRR